MAQFDANLMYELHADDLAQSAAIRNYVDHVVREIKTAIGWDADIQINIQAEATDEPLYSVAIGIFGLGDSIVIRKKGKPALAVLRKVGKAVLRQVNRVNKSGLGKEEKHFLGSNWLPDRKERV